jgi:hypothetical protein
MQSDASQYEFSHIGWCFFFFHRKDLEAIHISGIFPAIALSHRPLSENIHIKKSQKHPAAADVCAG